jgi:hypothetical protein
LNSILWRCPEVIRKTLPGILLSALLIAGCKKPEFGSELLNPDDAVTLFADSSLAIRTTLEREDSVRADELSLSLLGSFHDPLLGSVSAGIFAQLRMPASNLSFGNNPQADSLVLVLPYNGGFYGDISSAKGTQRFQVYRLTETLFIDSVYYSNDTAAYESVPIGDTGPVIPAPADSIVVNGIKQRPQLRIRLSNELAQLFLNNPGNFTDNTVFLDFFKGLFIKSTLPEDLPGNGAILDFRLTTGSGMELHYHNDTEDSLLVAFNINENSARFTSIKRNYSPEVINLLSTPALAQEKSFAANMAGLRTRVEFPNLLSWAGQRKLLINKARLVVPVDPDAIDKYPVNPLLNLITKDSSGNLLNTLDNLSGADYAGGLYDAIKKEYTFNIARHLQALIDGNIKDYGLFIQPLGTAVSSYRVRLNGGGHPLKPARLELFYQVLPTQQ